MGRFDEALSESRKAQQLDTLSLIIAADQGAILYYARQYDRAIDQLRFVLRKDPNSQRAYILIDAYVEKRMFAQALSTTESLRRTFGEGAWSWANRAYIYGRAGQLEPARSELEKAKHSTILTSLKVEPAFDPLRGDPRFQDLLRRVHLAE